MIKYETNSKLVTSGQVFVAIKGHTVDGHDFIEEAIKNGASKVVGERELSLSVPYERVKDSEVYLKEHLVNEYSDLFKDLNIIGITGTNGKTTSCYLIYQMLNLLGVNVAYLGTIGYYHNDEYQEVNNTTPDILSLYKILMDAVSKGVKYFVMEVSSHALSFERIAGLKLIRAAFTNLTEDHLDYHKTMENYLNEKLKILNYLRDDGIILLNYDDKNHYRFQVKNNWQTFGTEGNFKLEKYQIFPNYSLIKFSYHNYVYKVRTNLTSKFNVYNYMTAISVLGSLDFNMEDLTALSKKIYPPKGRCETYKIGNGYAVIDYAHTPDAVLKVIEAYNEIKKNKVITILGCGGDRDPIKRPIMGSIATQYSDYVIFTNDNPRTEDPKKIMNDIIKDNKSQNFEIIYDRKKAIEKGVSLLKDEDILLILGKGHEDYQIIGHTKYHFDDAEIIKNLRTNKKF